MRFAATILLQACATLMLCALGTTVAKALLKAQASPAPSSPLDVAAENYRPELAEDVTQCLAAVQLMRARVVAGDLLGAQGAWIQARVGWERAEVFTSGFTSELDAAIDAWPSAISGFHFIEARLFGARKLDVMPALDALIFHLTDLSSKVRSTALTGQGMLEGSARLAYEIGESKADGGESRFSGTSLDDMRNNIDGIDTAYKLVFAAALQQRNAPLANAAQTKIDQLRGQLRRVDFAAIDADQIRSASEDLVITLQRVAAQLGLERPSLSDLAQQ